MEKISANNETNKGFIPKIYKHLIQVNIKKKNKKQPNQKMGRRSKQTFIQRRHTDGKQANGKCSTLLNITEIANQNHNEVPPHIGQNGHH